jgi:hypothetical protein
VFSDENVQRYVKGMYPVAVLLMLVPLVDLSLRVFPPQFGTLQWRFATAGLFLGHTGTILLGTGLLGLIAVIAGHRRVLRILGFAALALGVIMLALLVLFALDAIQIRRLANPNFKRAVLLSATGALFNGLMGTITLFFLGRGGLAASRVSRAVERRVKPGVKPASPIVVARQAPAAEVAARPSATESV